ncbi:hypothetical protein CFC21_103164 [Triticum aestivum]|uniref:BTB domain-containing protein n=3 Tax=Triticum TaxID=4564 RepID=A0A9R1M7K0_WHEAT|nr:BTB/POZ and MATH domain-containing protein 3-like [Triticum aestivum]KAF7101963.1 hypothetical protein CFC21_103163 [Triticum aestivum]KAF7101964.1 hypothetical protein CFC21_103164 [Triticum aestivum]VAI88240.1 unnamed protein product [Triticum turgidum subsp. durum]
MVAATITKTARGTHVLDIHGFSGLRKKQCDVDGFLYSPTFTVSGLDWAVRYYPDGDNHHAGGNSESSDHVAAFVELVTEGAAAWARVGFGLVDQTTGETVPLFREKDPILFDASSEDTCTWGTGELARRRHLHAGSRYVLGDRLKIECGIDVCSDLLTFDDPPPSSGLPLFQQAGYGKEEPDVIIEVAGQTIAAHYCILDARAPGFLKRHIHTATTRSDRKVQISVDGGDMPAQSFKALVDFAYTDALPVVGGLNGAGHRAMIRHLLIAAERYGMGRLRAICERVLCKSLDVETVAATLAMADRHGFKELSEACAEFMAFP